LKLNGNGKIWTKDKFNLHNHLGLSKEHKLGTTFEVSYDEECSNLKTSLNYNKAGVIDANLGFELESSSKNEKENESENEQDVNYKINLDTTFNLPKVEWGAFGLKANYDLSKGEFTSLDQAFYTKCNNADIALVHKVDIGESSFDVGTFEGT